MKNGNQSKSEYILEQKLYIVNELISLIREHNIFQIKKLCKENKDIQLKLLNVKTEILKIDDKLEDILNFNTINDITEMDNAVSQVLNMINEEKAAYSIINNLHNFNDDIFVPNNIISKNKRKISSLDYDFYNKSEQYRSKINYDKNPEFAEKVITDYKEDCQKFIQEEIEYENLKNENLRNEEHYNEFDEQVEEIQKEWELEWKEICVRELMQAKQEFEAYTGLKNIQPDDKDFNAYYELRRNKAIKFTSCDYKSGNARVYTKYEVNGYIKDKPLQIKNVSKRQLPECVFTYLIKNNVIKECDFEKFFSNQFGRTFESKMGDIILEKDYPIQKNRQKRYTKIDCSNSESSDFHGVVYISNQWSEDSIKKYIDYIHKNYGEYIQISNPTKELMEHLKIRKITNNK